MEKHPHSNIRIILDKMAARAGAAYKQLMARSATLNLDLDPDPRPEGGSGSAYSYWRKGGSGFRIPDPLTVIEEKVDPDIDLNS